MTEQLELLPPTDHETEINRCIDEALHHVENQYVLRMLLSGATWGEAFGIGGRGGPGVIGWTGNAKGIEMDDGTIIKPDRIMQRARQYQNFANPENCDTHANP